MTERHQWQIINYLRSVEGKTPAKATARERLEEDTVSFDRTKEHVRTHSDAESPCVSPLL